MSEQPGTQVATRDRTRAAAVGLRLAGASYPEIAQTLGLHSEAEARDAVEQHLARVALDADPKRRELMRAESGETLRRLMRSVFAKATTPADPEHIVAVRAALAVQDRFIRLYGLDAPSEVVVHTPTTAEIDAWVALMLSQTPGIGDVQEADVIVVEGEVVDGDSAA